MTGVCHSTTSHRKRFANRCGVLRSNGSRSAAGTFARSRDPRRYGSLRTPGLKSSYGFRALADPIADVGCYAVVKAFLFIEVTECLCSYRWVLVYYNADTTSSETVYEFLCDENLKSLVPVFRGFLSPSNRRFKYTCKAAIFLAHMQRYGRHNCEPVPIRYVERKKPTRSRPNEMARLSGAFRPG